MSEHTEEEIALLRREKLASIGQLAASITHEINNPLAFVVSNLDVLEQYLKKVVRLLTAFRKFRKKVSDFAEPEDIVPLKKLEQDLDIDFLLEDIGELVIESKDGARRMRDIVHGLKRFSKMDDSEWEDVDLKTEIEHTIKIALPEVKKHGVIETELRDVGYIRCFPGQISQVILNLIVNAAHALGDEGEILVETLEEEERVGVSITDNGCGMDEKVRKQLFEPFFTTKKDVGTGLGLAISKDIIEKHRGSIDVQSELGKGSCFTIWLPRAKETV